MDSCPDLYPLTSLQIRDIKAHLSQAFLYFAPISHKFFILVDNQSWQKNKHSRSTHIRELMITKYRRSPFKNTKGLPKSPSFCLDSFSHERKNLFKWLRIINMATWREKSPFSMMNLYKALHGFLVFEVAWKNVQGINYLNELQADASMALEVKALRRWEFNGIEQALSCISSWFSGTSSETQTLKSNLILLLDKVPSNSSWGITVASKELLLNEASQAELFSEDVFFDVRDPPFDTDDIACMDHQVEEPSVEEDNDIESVEYKDTLLLLRFNNKDLPSKLRQIITSDLKLLTLLESGLPTWVIFFQSYPLFCKLYCPWMRPLFRTLYILISLVTVIIGFYDLYKNVPLLKAAASHLCGPLFKWIEAWDVKARLRYLGTMLFLQNFEKAMKWSLVATRSVKLLVSLLTKPFIYPLKEMLDILTPLWNLFSEMGELFYSNVWILVKYFYSVIFGFIEVLISPLEVLYAYLLILVKLASPFFSMLWKLFVFPTRGCLLLANYGCYLFSDIYEVLVKVIHFVASNVSQLTYFSRVKPQSSENSFWQTLWKDLFSKVFRSLRSILRVLFEFFASCNRHRLSIYNQLRATLYHLSNVGSVPSKCPCRRLLQVESNLKVDAKECERCK
ncbi:uncharacterized protein LOC112492820 isoform X1 [Ziziphus jujuba]|uniref:Uncharacterized protein LOC112492820 isoform X1 n=2 Tax=Ziziphus jujuba TaxID=326968 RepID=A0A6P6GFV0_ZIZJJ|nr:uncharacterized protein LOC112492820 isoform X1 [Ziziphus jujuba]